MARIGVNPARGRVSSYRPARLSLAMLTYIPDQTGYFEQRLEVLKLVFASLRAHTTLPHDLLVFDNGSCPPTIEFLRELQRSGQITYLLLSRTNIGKIDALHLLFQAAPGEIIAYSDDDILFYPGWLEAHLEILEHFPQAGMVSGLPVRNAARHACQSLERLAEVGAPGLQVSRERRIPETWELDWASSTGRDPQTYLDETRDQTDLVLRMQNPLTGGVCEAIGSANHFQFVTPKAVILQALPAEWTGKLMGHMIELDEAVDNLGYLRLSTVNRYTRHLGNTLSEDLLREAQAMGLLGGAGSEPRTLASMPRSKTQQPRHRPWLLRVPGARRLLMAVYRRLFDMLYR